MVNVSHTAGHVAYRGRVLVATLGYGVLSAVLYVLLFKYSEQLNLLAEATRNGEKIYALVPLIIIVIFSLVHGTFTSYFWDLLGLKAKR
jgi:hypothetical protein